MSNNLALCSVHTSSAMYGDSVAAKTLGCVPNGGCLPNDGCNPNCGCGRLRQDFERI